VKVVFLAATIINFETRFLESNIVSFHQQAMFRDIDTVECEAGILKHLDKSYGNRVKREVGPCIQMDR
jgi:hypothetical protein